ATLLGDLSTLWREAQPEERRRLVAPLLNGVFIDVESRMIAGLLPREPFRALLECAVDQVEGAPVVILPPGETKSPIMELVETGEAPPTTTPHRSGFHPASHVSGASTPSPGRWRRDGSRAAPSPVEVI